jgi:hypothetical protein
VFTPRVIITQLFLVFMIWFSAKLGKKILVITTIALLLLSLARLSSPPLFVLQTTVVLATGAVCYHRIREQEAHEIIIAFRNIFDRLTGK